MEKKRDEAISFLHTFGIILVVLGHSFIAYNDTYGEDAPNYLYSWRLFAMPLFMFMSGYLLKYTTRAKNRPLGGMTAGDIGKFIAKKAKRLLIPYIVISSAVFPIKAIMSAYAIHPVEMTLESYIYMLAYPLENAIRFFWFLPTLFVIFFIVAIGAYFLKRLRIKIHPAIILLILLIPHFTPIEFPPIRLLNIGGAINLHLLYFASGYYACQYNLSGYIEKHRNTILALTFVISIILTFTPTSSLNTFVKAYNGIIMSFALAHVYVHHQCKFLNPYFEASFAIYLFSWFPQVTTQQILLSFVPIPWLLDTILAFATGFFIPYFIYRLIIRYKHTQVGRVVALLTGQ